MGSGYKWLAASVIASIAGCGSSTSPEIGGTAVGSESDGTDDGASYEDGGEVELPAACTDDTPTFSDPLRRRTTVDSPGGVLTSLAVADDDPSRLYGCTTEAGLVVWDVSDPGAPEMTASGVGQVRCDDVAVDASGARVVTSSRGRVEVLEGGAQPSLIAAWDATVAVERAIVSEDRVYVAAGTDGIIELSLSGDTLTVAQSYDDAMSDARAVSIADGQLYAAEARSGVRVYDTGLSPIRTVQTDGTAVDIDTDASTVAVATLDAVSVFGLGDDSPASESTAGVAVAVSMSTAGTVLVADWTGLAHVTTDVLAGIRRLSGEPLFASEPLDRFSDVAATTDHLFATDGSRLVVLATDTAAAPDIFVYNPRIDFITLAAGESKTRAVTVDNVGDAELVICAVESDVPGVTTDTSSAVIPPGGALIVEVAIEGQSADRLEGHLTIISSDPDQSELQVPLFANPDRVDVGESMAPFHLVGVDGRPVSSDDLAGQVAFLTYFATW